MDKRSYVRISDVTYENKTHTTLALDISSDVRPGQFFMLTDYEHGEKPFSVSRICTETVSITVKNIGSFSGLLHTSKPGDHIAIRGPYGNGFDLTSMYDRRILMIGGGCGTAPLRSLLEAIGKRASVDFVNGARTADELLFPGQLNLSASQYDVTDDGSAGRQGTVLDVCAGELGYDEYDMIIASGPEVMLAALINSLDGFERPSFFLIERYMKCAIGICGQCCIDPEGIRVCVEGPVFEREKLASLDEFGSYARDAAGIRRFLG